MKRLSPSILYYLCRHATYNSEIRYIFCDNSTRTYYCSIAYFDTIRHDDNSHSYPNVITNDSFCNSHSLLSHWNICTFDVMRVS